MSDGSRPSPSGGDRRTGWAELESGETVELATPLRRLGARLLDGIVISVVILGPFIAIYGRDGFDTLTGAGDRFVEGALFTIVLGLGYEVTQTAVWGQTIGKRMTRIKVISAAHGGEPGWNKSIARWVIPGLLGLIPAVGGLLSLLFYVSLLWDRVYQGWHDRVAGTLVTKQ